MLKLHYKTKKALREAKGQHLRYTETSLFGPEMRPPCKVTGCNEARSWFAEVWVDADGKIQKVA